MGNKPSQPARPPPPPPPAPAPAPPPPNPAQVCALRSVELNQIKTDLTNKQAQVDSCDPQGAQARLTNAAIAANTDYVTQKRSKFNELLQTNTNSVSIYKNVRDAIAPIVTVGSDASEETKRLEEENLKYIRSQRKERRSFLDSDPLAGVGDTSDNSIMLAFWITFGLSLIIATIYLLNVYGGSMDFKQKSMTGASIVALSYGIVYYLITQYG